MSEREPGFRKVANDNEKPRELKGWTEDVLLNLPHAHAIRMTIDHLRCDEEFSHRFSALWVQQAQEKAAAIPLPEAIQILNTSIRKDWEENPAYYRELLTMVDDYYADQIGEDG